MRLAEHPDSDMRNLFAGLRFRNHNMPGKEVHVTEWGWDASSANETAFNSAAVSALAQAVYALRGLFWLSRMGVDRAHWFFFGNVHINYDRSCLKESLQFGFKEKRAFFAAEAMQCKMGHLYFDAVLREDAAAYIYLLRDSTGTQTHLIAWRSVAGNDSLAVSTPLAAPYVANTAWYLSGLDVDGELLVIPSYNGVLQLPLSSKPLLIPITQIAQQQKRGLHATLAARVTDQKVTLDLETNAPLKNAAVLQIVAVDSWVLKGLAWAAGVQQLPVSVTDLNLGTYLVRLYN